jgi:hypothetical protein
MTAQTWSLEGSRAALHAGPLAATLDLVRPALGVREIYYHGQPLAISLLALETPRIAQLDGTSLLEHYVQCDNLMAAYGESSSWPVRVDGRWCAGVDGPPTALDLVVSVRTPLLDSQPQMAVQNTVTATGAWRLVSANAGRFEPWPVESGPQEPLNSPPQSGCFLFRLPGDAWSCAAMVHPADFTRAELSAGAGEPRAFRLAYRLFPGRLEKGVILRARVRCLFLPRNSDLSLAAAHYASFVAAEPPLGP